MSFVVPVAKAVAKKTIPKTKLGKVAATAGATVIGANVFKGDKAPDKKALTPSQEAESQNPPVGQSGTKTLLNLPKGTQISVGQGTYTSASELEGDAEKYFAAKTPEQRAALLLRLGQIPNLYPAGQAPTPAYVSSMGNRIVWRPADATALKNILSVTDQLGDASADVTITNLISNPGLASKYFGKVTSTTAVTPGEALSLELENKFLDLFNDKPSKDITNSYIKDVQKLESSGKSTSDLKENILLKYVQKQAGVRISESQTPGTPSKIESGALGNIVRNIRGAYADNGIPINDKQIYQQSIDSLRSADAYKNVISNIQLQAATIMPAFKDLIMQGRTVKSILSPYINLRSQILEIPEEQIKVSDMYDVASGEKVIPIQDYKSKLYASNEYRNTSGFKQRSLGDMKALLNAFGIGG